MKYLSSILWIMFFVSCIQKTEKYYNSNKSYKTGIVTYIEYAYKSGAWYRLYYDLSNEVSGVNIHSSSQMDVKPGERFLAYYDSLDVDNCFIVFDKPVVDSTVFFKITGVVTGVNKNEINSDFTDFSIHYQVNGLTYTRYQRIRSEIVFQELSLLESKKIEILVCRDNPLISYPLSSLIIYR